MENVKELLEDELGHVLYSVKEQEYFKKSINRNQYKDPLEDLSIFDK